MTPSLNKMVYDTYISYSHSDDGIVTKIAERLKNKNDLDVFFDKWVLKPGDRHAIMHETIYKSKTFIACIGEEEPKSWHREEIECAIQRGIDDPAFLVMAILLSEKSKNYVPISMRHKSWVDLSKGDEEENFKQILSSINAVVSVRENKKLVENLEIDGNQDWMKMIKEFQTLNALYKSDLISKEIYNKKQEERIEKIFEKGMMIESDNLMIKLDNFMKEPRDG
jgi:hypothetical protein